MSADLNVTSSLGKNKFIRAVAVLAGGTAMGQMILVAALPVLTRLYSPDDFGALAVYVAILGIISTIACLRYEVAIPLPVEDKDAINLLVISLVGAFLVSLLVGLFLFALPRNYLLFLGNEKLFNFIWLVPIGIWLAGSYGALQYWATRKKNFSLIGRAKIGQAISGVVVQVGLGWVGVATVGLLLGHMVSNGAAAFGFALRVIRQSRSLFSHISLVNLRAVSSEYSRFPKYSILEALANSAAIQAPIIIIAALTFGKEAGYLMLAMRVMQAPMSLVGSAISQVYLSRAVEELKAGNLAASTLNVIEGLIKLGVGPLIFMGLISSAAFPLVFGAAWARAGVLVAWMTPWFVFQLMVSPVATILYVKSQQKIALILQVAGLILRVGVVLLASKVATDFVPEAYALSGGVFYFVYLWVVLKVAGISAGQIFVAIRKGIAIVCGWTVLGLLVVYFHKAWTSWLP